MFQSTTKIERTEIGQNVFKHFIFDEFLIKRNILMNLKQFKIFIEAFSDGIFDANIGFICLWSEYRLVLFDLI